MGSERKEVVAQRSGSTNKPYDAIGFTLLASLFFFCARLNLEPLEICLCCIQGTRLDGYQCQCSEV